MKTYKVRLPPKQEGVKGEVVTAEYLHQSACKNIHVVKHNGEVYFASGDPLSHNYPYICRFVGAGAVMRAE